MTPEPRAMSIEDVSAGRVCDVLGDLCRVAWTTAEAHGFHEPLSRRGDGSIDGSVERDAERAGPWRTLLPATPMERLALIGAEVGEAIAYYQRTGKPDAGYVEADGKPEGVAAELADACIRIFDYCAIYGIPLGAVLLHKLAYNEHRPYKHGKVV